MRTLEEVLAAHPPPFNLLPYQAQDIERIVGHRRSLLDWPVGAGKTVASTYASLMLQPDLTIILVPPILMVQWVKWLNSIAGRALNYVGSPKHRAGLLIERFDWIVMSYQVFLNDMERFRKACAGAEVFTIVDEAQAIRGRGALWKGVRDFTQGRDLLMMSGTLMSKPGDAYAYIKLLTPEVYRTYAQFEGTHVLERDFFEQPKVWGNLDILEANLNARRIKRTKEEVTIDLPKPRYIPIYYDLSKEHMALYRRLMEEQLLALDDGSKIDATTATRLYHAAQQIITNYGFFAGDETKRSVVFDLIDAVMDEIGLGTPGASKLILWTIYRRTSAAVHAHVNAQLAARRDGTYGVAAYGDVNSKKSIAAFLDDPFAIELTAQPGSAGAGLNPQHLCWECGFIETPTTTIPFVQSSGRIDRKGQRYNPNIRLLIARGTIQERLLANLFDNDQLVQKASGSRQGIKDLIFP